MKRHMRTNISLLLVLMMVMAAVGEVSATDLQWLISLKGKGDFSLKMPTAFMVDEQKNRYYVVDSGNNQLVSYDKEGNLVNILTANNSLSRPFDMVRDQAGTLWVVEKGRNSLTSIDLESKQVAPHILKYRGALIFPDRVEYENGSFFVLNKATGSIVVLDQSLNVQQMISCPDSGDVFVDFKLRNGTIFALERSGGAVFQFRMDGTLVSKISLDRSMQFPVSLAVNNKGIYVLDRHAGSVETFDLQGHYLESFLGAGHARGRLYYPIELQFDPWGRLCVVDEGNGRVEIFGY